MEMTIKVNQLSKSYGSIPAVSNLSFSVEKGQIFGLLGANGAGKSTALECILGTKTSDSGDIAILGMNPLKQRKKLFERVGVQFQEGSYQDKIPVCELCEEIQSLYKTHADYKQLLSHFGLIEKLKDQVNQLSGGQKQKLFIVLALIPDPDVVFLDELTTGLDTKSRRDVWKYLSELKNKGLTILLTSHFMDEVEILCDMIGILKQGKLIFYGTIDEAISKSPYDSFENAYLWYTGEEAFEYESI